MRLMHLGLSFISLVALASSAGCGDDDNDGAPGSAGTSGANAGSGGKSTTGGNSSGGSRAGSSAQGGTGGRLQLGGAPGDAGGEGGVGVVGGDAATGGQNEGGSPDAGGAGGAAGGPAANVELDATTHTLLATDGEVTRALYFFGADRPASSTTAATSTCVGDCIATWPVYHRSSIVSGDGLSAEDFGELLRPDGKSQTTFKGWPLYSYVNDSVDGDRKGEGVGRLWHAAVEPFYTVVLMQGTFEGEPTGPYLADAQGHAIYRFVGDTLGTANSDPVSTCTTNGCRKAWPVFSVAAVRPVSSIGGSFKPFLRDDTDEIQLAFAGIPLYWFAQDKAPGDLVGLTKNDWLLVKP